MLIIAKEIDHTLFMRHTHNMIIILNSLSHDTVLTIDGKLIKVESTIIIHLSTFERFRLDKR